MAELATNLPRTAEIIRAGMEEGLHVGAQVYVSKGGKIVVDDALGEAGPEIPMQTDTLMLWRSSTKPITAIALAQQFDAERLDWDDPVVFHIPEFGQQGKESFTIRHLLTHTAGLRSTDRLPEGLGWRETLERICATAPEANWEPAKKAGYHLGSTWLVLAEIVHRLDGRPFEVYVRNQIFTPFSMSDSWIGMPPERYREYGNRIGLLYMTDKAEPKPHPSRDSEAACSQCRPGSNGRGPIKQLGHFYEELLGILGGQTASSNRIVEPETLKSLTRRHRVGLFDQTFQHTIDWGLGFIIDSNRYGKETVPYGYGRHCSDTTFGHSGAQSSTGFADPEHQLVVAWIMNGTCSEKRHQERARAINSAIYEDLQLMSEAVAQT